MARILIGCEESQVVTKAFRDRGHEAYSCDLVETRGNPEWHIQGDIMSVMYPDYYDLIILHPPCRYMANSGNRWHSGTEERRQAIQWTRRLWGKALYCSNRVAMENPVSMIWNHVKRAQYIQPYMFGDMEQKKTGLALRGLPLLEETNNVYDEMMKLPKNEREKKFYMAPGPNRERDRSVTYQGIADAMADQWGHV